jgi:hypothetical protein
MPPTRQRGHSVDLLLCGHHYRVSRQALAAARARIEYLPGKADAAEAALLRSVRRDHAEVRWRSSRTAAPVSPSPAAVVGAYALTFASAMLAFGMVGDEFDRKKVMLAGAGC